MHAKRDLALVFFLAWLAVPLVAQAQFNRSGQISNRNGTQSSMFGSGSNSSSQSGSGSGAFSMGDLETRASQAASSTEFLRSSRGAESFVGSDASDMRNFLGFEESTTSLASPQRRTATRSNRSNTLNLQRSAANRGTRLNGGRTATASEVQPTIELGFSAQPATPSSGLAVQLTTRLRQTERLGLVGPVQVEVRGGVATLRGQVVSEHDRQLAEQLLALEPGVRQIDNRLSVASPAAR